ncbi:hypothetical protein GS885_28395 [Rhodococcus hoagii]|nr:hypothetical protein [Prescottella equi]
MVCFEPRNVKHGLVAELVAVKVDIALGREEDNGVGVVREAPVDAAYDELASIRPGGLDQFIVGEASSSSAVVK